MLDKAETIDIGVDVARFGSDNTVIAPKVNNAVLPLRVRNGIDTVETANETLAIARELRQKYHFTGKVYVKVDDTGIGGGVTDAINRMKRAEAALDWLVLVAVNFARSVHHAYYQDFNTVLWGCLKDLLEDGLIALPNDPDLIGELTNRKKEISSNGKIKIESKDKMKKRGLPSPDRGDAVALAAYPIVRNTEEKRREGKRR